MREKIRPGIDKDAHQRQNNCAHEINMGGRVKRDAIRHRQRRTVTELYLP